MNTNNKQIDAGILGRVFNPDKPGHFDDGTVNLPDPLTLGFRPYSTRAVGLPPGQQIGTSTASVESFGMPVDAELAIYLIANALQKTTQFSNFIEANHAESRALKTVTEALETLSYGITFSKKYMQQILDQDGCEGMRAYLCSRENAGDDKAETPYHTSLVMLGVDVNGYDLGYSPDKITGVVPTNSVLIEYGYPPGARAIVNKETDEIDEHYVLLKLASDRP